MNTPLSWRHHTIVVVLVVLFVAVAHTAAYNQIVRAEYIRERSDWRAAGVEQRVGARGPITDREGRVLAESVPEAQIVLDPRHFFGEQERLLAAGASQGDRRAAWRARAALVRAIAPLPGFDAARFAAWESAEGSERPQWFPLASNVPRDVADAMLRSLRRNGVRSMYTSPQYRRVYPRRDIAGHLVGFASRDGSAGLSGVEAAFDAQLRGRAYEVPLEYDSARRNSFLVGETPDADAARGQTVVLTLDLPLQRFVEDALSETVEHFRAGEGTVVVSVPATGEVLAMASWPPIDPNQVRNAAAIEWRNPAVSNLYEPGSTAKMFTFAAALEGGVINADTMIDCMGGSIRIGGHDIRDTHRMGVVPAWEVMAQSSNIGALQIGRMLHESRGQEFHFDILHAFGFGERTGIGLPGDAVGSVRPLPWRSSEAATLSYGYGFNMSPLQLNLATAAIANDGMRMEPMLVLRREDADGNVIDQSVPRQAQQVIAPETAARLTDILATVTGEHGTGRAAGVPGFVVAGKTGTAVIHSASGYGEDYMASFSGFLPADDPQFAITVIISRPDPEIAYYGGAVAAPLFGRIAAQALALHGSFPEAGAPVIVSQPISGDDASAETISDVAVLDATAALPSDPALNDFPALPTAPDLRGMWLLEAMQAAGRHGLVVEVVGSGRVVSQEPAPGAAAVNGSAVRLTLEDGGLVPAFVAAPGEAQ